MSSINCPICKSHGLNNEYLFCPHCGIELAKVGICKNCNNKNDPSSKFCQECGAPLQNKLKDISSKVASSTQKVIIDIESIPTSGITIEFGYSSSANFDFAIQEAELFSSFKQFGEGKKIQNRVNLQTSEIASSVELVKYIKEWKGSRIYVDGERSSWEAVYSFLWCYEKRNSSYRPELYCFGYENDYELNIWGCIQCHMPFKEHAKWVEWGRWLNNNPDWEFDKEHIAHELQKELYSYRFCPAINLELVKDAISALPEKINPKQNKNWKFVESWGDDDLSAGLVITKKEYGYEEKVTIKGVAPKGRGALQEVVHRMKQRLPKEITGE